MVSEKMKKFLYLMQHPSELTQLEMQRAYSIGSIIAVIGADLCIILLVPMATITKIFIGLGGLCGAGMLSASLKAINSQIKNYIETQKEMEKIKAESDAIMKSAEEEAKQVQPIGPVEPIEIDTSTDIVEQIKNAPKNSCLIYDESGNISEEDMKKLKKMIAGSNVVITKEDIQ